MAFSSGSMQPQQVASRGPEAARQVPGPGPRPPLRLPATHATRLVGEALCWGEILLGGLR